MEHDFDPLTQACKTCGLGRAEVEDDPMAARCVGMTVRGRHKMAIMVTAEELAEIEKMPQPFRLYAQLIGRDVVEKIAADILNGGMEDARSREQWTQALDETLPAPPLPDRGFGV